MTNTLLCITSPDRLPQWKGVVPATVSFESDSAASQVLARMDHGEDFVAVIVDMSHASTEAALTNLRARHPLLPILVVLRAPSGELINLAHGLRCEVVCGLPAPQQVAGFLARAERAGRLSSEDLHGWVQRLLDRHELRTTDAQLVPVVLGEESVDDAGARLGFTPKQMTRRMRALCRRCGARTSVGAARNLMRDALVHGRQRAQGEAPGVAQMSQVA